MATLAISRVEALYKLKKYLTSVAAGSEIPSAAEWSTNVMAVAFTNISSVMGDNPKYAASAALDIVDDELDSLRHHLQDAVSVGQERSIARFGNLKRIAQTSTFEAITNIGGEAARFLQESLATMKVDHVKYDESKLLEEDDRSPVTSLIRVMPDSKIQPEHSKSAFQNSSWSLKTPGASTGTVLVPGAIQARIEEDQGEVYYASTAVVQNVALFQAEVDVYVYIYFSTGAITVFNTAGAPVAFPVFDLNNMIINGATNITSNTEDNLVHRVHCRVAAGSTLTVGAPVGINAYVRYQIASVEPIKVETYFKNLTGDLEDSLGNLPLDALDCDVFEGVQRLMTRLKTYNAYMRSSDVDETLSQSLAKYIDAKGYTVANYNMDLIFQIRYWLCGRPTANIPLDEWRDVYVQWLAMLTLGVSIMKADSLFLYSRSKDVSTSLV